MSQETQGARLKQAMNATGKLDRDEFARALGVSVQAIGLVLSGATKSLTAENCSKAAKFLGVSTDWLATGAGEMTPQKSTQPVTKVAIDLSAQSDLIAIENVRFTLSAGIDGFAVEVDQGKKKPIYFRAEFLKDRGYKADKLFCVHVTGRSMEPSFFESDLVVINTAATEPAESACFAVNYEGQMVIKRLRKESGDWWAYSDNQDQRMYAKKRCGEDVFIIGRVVYRQTEQF